MSAIPRLSAGVCCGVVSRMRNRCRILTYYPMFCRFAMERKHKSSGERSDRRPKIDRSRFGTTPVAHSATAASM